MDAGRGNGGARLTAIGRQVGNSKTLKDARPGGWMNDGTRITRILGDAGYLLCHLLQMTLVFVALVAAIYALRTSVALIFSPGEYLRKLLALADTYAVLLGTIGYGVWISLDLFFLRWDQRQQRHEA